MGDDQPIVILTKQERRIVHLVAQGLTNKEIALRLDSMEGTVKVHLHNIFQKLEVPNRTALTALSFKQKIS